jgi:RecA-family ATPase
MAARPEFLVDEIFPADEVHLIYGPSASGKTSWALPFLEDLIQGRPIFNRTSYPTPCCYLALDRSTRSIQRVLARLGLPEQMCPFLGVERTVDEPNLDFVFNTAANFKAEAILIEGFLRVLRSKSNDFNVIADMLSKCTKRCQDRHVTVFGVMHTPKTRGGNNELLDPRQKALGSVAFSAMAETSVLIEPIDAADPTDMRRVITVMPRNAKAFRLEYIFDWRGRLTMPGNDPADAKLDAELKAFAGTEFSRQTALEWGRKHGIAERTVEYWLQKRKDKSIQQLKGRGRYAKLKI